eukprot:snap_masked-scaffold_13-processed-gene-11.48-mRNA-1 protein AED:1.00 eAED:1.00 QI:0/0/0/0/1/1/2/0/393
MEGKNDTLSKIASPQNIVATSQSFTSANSTGSQSENKNILNNIKVSTKRVLAERKINRPGSGKRRKVLKGRNKAKKPEIKPQHKSDAVKEYLLAKQNNQSFARHECLQNQEDLTEKNRAKLLSWLLQVGESFCMTRKTVHQSFFLIDLFLSREEIEISDLQLLGSCCLYICAKINEVRHVDSAEFIYLLDGLYSKSDLFEMEQKIFTVVGFESLNPCTSLDWIMFYWSKIELKDLTLGCHDQANKLYGSLRNFPKYSQSKMVQDVFKGLVTLIEAAYLDVNTFKHTPQELALAAINEYLIQLIGSDERRLVKHLDEPKLRCKRIRAIGAEIEYATDFAQVYVLDATFRKHRKHKSLRCIAAKEDFYQFQQAEESLYRFFKERYYPLNIFGHRI